MVDRGATVNHHGQHGRTPLHKAIEYAYPLLLMAHCGPWYDNIPKARRSETIQALLSCGADVHAVNPRGRGVLHLACTENDHMAIETFIEGMADVNRQDLAGFPPLMWAAGRNGTESVKMLLDYEADMNAKAAKGQTAATFALTNGCNAIIDILEKHQAILDAEEAKRIREKGEKKCDIEQEDIDETLQFPRPDWA